MDAWQKRFSQVLAAALEAEIVSRTSGLVTTKAADYAAYRERAGVIDGLKLALDQMRELEKDLDRPEQRGDEVVQRVSRYES